MRRARFIPLVVLLVGSRSLAAQWQANVDLGVSRLEQIGIPESNAQTLGINASGLFSRFQVLGNLLTARTSESRWTSQALGAGSLFGRFTPRVQWELSGIASVFGETNAQTASSAEALARTYFSGASFGTSLAVGAGTRRADAGRQPLARAIANAWMDNLAGRFTGELSYVHTSTTPFAATDRITLAYTDASVGWRLNRGRFGAGAVAGVRTSNDPIVPDGGWGSADVTAWLTSHIALVVAGGQSPQDVVRGVPRIRYLSGAVRIAIQPVRKSLPAVMRTKGPHLAATRDGIAIQVPKAATVEIMADFTDWLPVTLTRDGDTWRLDRALAPGVHRLAMRIDGGEWIAPANLPATKDDLGGVVALVAIP